MTHEYRRLHRAVDRLDPAQAKAVLEMLKSMLGEGIVADPAVTSNTDAPGSKAHRFSFTGVAEGPGDLSERVDEYLEGFGEPRSCAAALKS